MKLLLAKLMRLGRRTANLLPARLQAPFRAISRSGTGPRQEPPPDHVEWAFRPVPLRLCTANFLMIGMAGTGKTTLIRLFLQSLLPRFGLSTDPARPVQRAILFDAKRDWLPLLDGVFRSNGLSVVERPQVVVTNPFDARCLGWNIARDIASSGEVRDLVATLLPCDERAPSPFWSAAAQDVARAVILSLVLRKAPDWSLRDVIVICRSAKLIRQATWDCPEAWSIVASYLDNPDLFTNVLATLTAKLVRYEGIAAIWHNLPVNRRFSVTDWFHGGGVLLLGSDPDFYDSLTPLNAVILKLAVDRLLAGPETQLPTTWFVLDEFSLLGHCPALKPLLSQGGSKGASVVVSVQDISSLDWVCGKQAAREIMNQCAHRVFMNVDRESAHWMADHFREYQLTLNLDGVSETKGNEGTKSGAESRAKHIPLTTHYFASNLTALLSTAPATGFIRFISDSPSRGREWIEVAWSDVERRLIAPSQEHHFVPHASADVSQLAPWSQEVDLERLRLKVPPQPGTPKSELLPGSSDAAKPPGPESPPDGHGGVQPQLPDLFRD